jgi:hypothetical protein
MKSSAIDTKRFQTDIRRVATQAPQYEKLNTKLMEVTAWTLIAGSDARYNYIVREAYVGGSTPYTPTNSGYSGLTYDALSVSELSNGTNPLVGYYSYGILKTHLPVGFGATHIPVGTFVLCVPHNKTNGGVVYLIINTQAIDGVC